MLQAGSEGAGVPEGGRVARGAGESSLSALSVAKLSLEDDVPKIPLDASGVSQNSCGAALELPDLS